MGENSTKNEAKPCPHEHRQDCTRCGACLICSKDAGPECYSCKGIGSD